MKADEKNAYEKFARLGFVVKGVLYFLAGTLAILAAVGSGGKTTGRMGILQWIEQQPSGPFLLILVTIGLLGYAVLRLMQAIEDTNHKGSDKKGLLRRAGYFISSIPYLALFIASFYILFQRRILEDEEGTYIDDILHFPGGHIIVAISGVYLFGYGIFEIVRGFKGSFKHQMNFENLEENSRKMLNIMGVLGYVARGIVLCIVGFIMIRATFKAYVENSGLSSQVFHFLSFNLSQFIMGMIAAGLALYGIFMFVKARYYQINTK